MPLKAYMRGDYAIEKRGIMSVAQTDIENQGLKKLSKISVQGIPNPWGAGLLFSWMLAESNPDEELKTRISNAKTIFIKLLKGIFCGVLDIQEEELNDRTPLLKIFREMSPLNAYGARHQKLLFFCWDDKVVAVGYPECILFPAATFSDWPEFPPRNDEEKELFALIDGFFAGPNRGRNEELFLEFLEDLLSQNSQPLKINVPWFRAIQEYIVSARPSTGGSRLDRREYENQTEEFKEIELVSGFDPGRNTATIENFRLRRLRLIVPESIRYQQGKIITNLKEFALEDYGIVYDGRDTYIFNDPKTQSKRPDLLHNLFRWKIEHQRILISYRAVEKEISGKIISDPEREILVDKILMFEGTKGPGFPDIPVRSQFLNLVLGVQKHSPDRGSVEYSIDIKGYGKIPKKYTLGAGTVLLKKPAEFSPNLVLWPDFRSDSWQAHFAFFCSGGRERSFYFKVFDNEGHPYEVRNQTAAFSPRPFVRAILVDGSANSEHGVYQLEDKYDEISGSPRPEDVWVGIDFGTSNSCVSQRLPGPSPEDEIFSIPDRCRFIFENRESYLNQEFFPHLDESEKLDIIPSELLMKHGDIDDANGWQNVVVDYSIPIVKGEKSFEWIVDNIKWHNRDKYLKAYFCELFFLIFAAVRKNGYQRIKLGLTYPHSFTRSKLRRHFESILNVLDYASQKTGVEVTGIKILTESAVGASVFSDIRKKKLVVDMGGGTTDIALLSETGVTIFSDSVRFAGNDLVEILAMKKVGGDQTSAQKLNRMIRFGVPMEGIDQAASEIGDHFEVLYDILRRFLAAAQDDGELRDEVVWRGQGIQICKLGQGWKFLRFTNFNNQLVMEKYFHNFKMVEPTGDPKKVLAVNILKELPTCGDLNEFRIWITSTERDSRPECGRRSIVGANFGLYIKKGRSARACPGVTWKTEIPYAPEDFSRDDALVAQLDDLTKLLASGRDNKLGQVLQELIGDRVLSIEEVMAAVNSDINTGDYGLIGPDERNQRALLISPFILFVEKMKEKWKEHSRR